MTYNDDTTQKIARLELFTVRNGRASDVDPPSAVPTHHTDYTKKDRNVTKPNYFEPSSSLEDPNRLS